MTEALQRIRPCEAGSLGAERLDARSWGAGGVSQRVWVHWSFDDLTGSAHHWQRAPLAGRVGAVTCKALLFPSFRGTGTSFKPQTSMNECSGSRQFRGSRDSASFPRSRYELSNGVKGEAGGSSSTSPPTFAGSLVP